MVLILLRILFNSYNCIGVDTRREFLNTGVSIVGKSEAISPNNFAAPSAIISKILVLETN